MMIHRQWASRPADERYTSLPAMLATSTTLQQRSRTSVLAMQELKASVQNGELMVAGPRGNPARLTHWSYSQLTRQVGAPAGYLAQLPTELAADCLNANLQGDATKVKALLAQQGDLTLRALTGPRYGRIWNADIIRALMQHVGDGVTGDWKVPGEFGKAVVVTKDNTTFYMSDRDMFVALADERHRIELPNRRDGKPGSLARGVILSNSEVGKSRLYIASFLFDFICANRIIWGMQGWEEVSIRHSSGAPGRWLGEAIPQLAKVASLTMQRDRDTLLAAQRARLGGEEPALAWLGRQVGTTDAQGAWSTHMDEEGRPIETVWDAVTGVTAWARGRLFQDERVALETAAGKMLASVDAA